MKVILVVLLALAVVPMVLCSNNALGNNLLDDLFENITEQLFVDRLTNTFATRNKGYFTFNNRTSNLKIDYIDKVNTKVSLYVPFMLVDGSAKLNDTQPSKSNPNTINYVITMNSETMDVSIAFTARPETKALLGSQVVSVNHTSIKNSINKLNGKIKSHVQEYLFSYYLEESVHRYYSRFDIEYELNKEIYKMDGKVLTETSIMAYLSLKLNTASQGMQSIMSWLGEYPSVYTIDAVVHVDPFRLSTFDIIGFNQFKLHIPSISIELKFNIDSTNNLNYKAYPWVKIYLDVDFNFTATAGDFTRGTCGYYQFQPGTGSDMFKVTSVEQDGFNNMFNFRSDYLWSLVISNWMSTFGYTKYIKPAVPFDMAPLLYTSDTDIFFTWMPNTSYHKSDLQFCQLQ
ncbi:hypothetical protein SAMD00019534_037120 [Acytostelium subglobosum LB1]|uniref:hypothetical protein n=1 Tax=Acytostelium subglobosum LB1 TaxID=1410327 RepID=UPI000644F8E2|nr:hypothetical protein SAMD00019534_037120 [Acytostelium subglobosum LB1]GAM20537.1 hypothetical protein SAMD00019534_037120 [Acytostelium subglobosum LB1]|eukprot:XP_012760058.1 hypothetical protein SAMD00019534_037120 [Acytostelium subglobosum LB1]